MLGEFRIAVNIFSVSLRDIGSHAIPFFKYSLVAISSSLQSKQVSLVSEHFSLFFLLVYASFCTITKDSLLFRLLLFFACRFVFSIFDVVRTSAIYP